MQYLLYTFSGVWLFLSHTQFWEVGVCSLKLNKAENSLVIESFDHWLFLSKWLNYALFIFSCCILIRRIYIRRSALTIASPLYLQMYLPAYICVKIIFRQ